MMSQKRKAAVSEILSAVAVIGTTAAIAGILAVIFYERADDTEERMGTRIDEAMKKASELIAIDNISCINGTMNFIIHNYSKETVINLNETRWLYQSGENVIETAMPNIFYFNGTFAGPDGIIDHGRSVRAESTLGCGEADEQIIMITPSKEFMEVR